MVRDLHRAILAVAISLAVLTAALALTYARREKLLTSAELRKAAWRSLSSLVELAVREGGLTHPERMLEEEIGRNLAKLGYGGQVVEVRRYNDFEPLAAFLFEVEAEGVVATVSVEGQIDPLLAIRLGINRTILSEPNTPYEFHGEEGVLSSCLANHYYHYAVDAPDFFARLENRTSDPYHYGFESFLLIEGQLVLDHKYLESGEKSLSLEDRERYGLS